MFVGHTSTLVTSPLQIQYINNQKQTRFRQLFWIRNKLMVCKHYNLIGLKEECGCLDLLKSWLQQGGPWSCEIHFSWQMVSPGLSRNPHLSSLCSWIKGSFTACLLANHLCWSISYTNSRCGFGGNVSRSWSHVVSVGVGFLSIFPFTVGFGR